MIDTLTRRPAVQRLFALGVLLLLLIVTVRHAVKVQEGRSAFLRWRSQLLHLDDGVDLSARFNYPNPPIMAVLLEPLARLPPRVGAHLWFSLELAMAATSLLLLGRLVEGDRPLPAWGWMLLVLCSLKPVIDELTHGNVNLFVFFLLVVALTAFQRRRDLLAGGLLALAIACKVTPALFVPYFLWKRSWRLLAGVVVGLLLFLLPGVVPALRLGMDDNLEQLHSWYRVMVRPYVLEGKATSEYLNQSLPGVVARLLTEQPSLLRWVGDTAVPARMDNLLSLSPEQGRWLVKGCFGLYLLALAWRCRTPTDPDRHGPGLAAEFALVTLGMLLFSERTWKHHAVTLMLPFAVLVRSLSDPTARAGWRGRAAGGLLAAAVLLMLLCGLSNGSDRSELARAPGLAKTILIYGGYTAAFVLLLGAVAVTPRPAAPAAAGRSVRQSVPCPLDSPPLPPLSSKVPDLDRSTRESSLHA